MLNAVLRNVCGDLSRLIKLYKICIIIDFYRSQNTSNESNWYILAHKYLFLSTNKFICLFLSNWKGRKKEKNVDSIARKVCYFFYPALYAQATAK